MEFILFGIFFVIRLISTCLILLLNILVKERENHFKPILIRIVRVQHILIKNFIFMTPSVLLSLRSPILLVPLVWLFFRDMNLIIAFGEVETKVTPFFVFELLFFRLMDLFKGFLSLVFMVIVKIVTGIDCLETEENVGFYAGFAYLSVCDV